MRVAPSPPASDAEAGGPERFAGRNISGKLRVLLCACCVVALLAELIMQFARDIASGKVDGVDYARFNFSAVSPVFRQFILGSRSELKGDMALSKSDE